MGKLAAVPFICLMLLSSPPAVLAASFASLDISDEEVNGFIERLSVKGLIDLHTNTLPLRSDEALGILSHLIRRLEAGEISLTPVERGILERIVRSIPTLKGEGERFGFDPSGEAAIGESGGRYLSLSAKPALFGAIGDGISFFSGFKWGVLGGRENYAPLPGERVYATGDLWQVSSVVAYLNLRLTRSLLLTVGRRWMWWGPGRFGSLILSHNSGPKDMMGLELRTRRIRFVSFTSILKSKMGNKRISGHRLELTPFSWVRVGIHELILYSNRFEIGYLNPVTIYFVSQPMTEYGINTSLVEGRGATDNLLIGGDLTIRPVSGMELYGELLIDDFQPQERLKGFKNWDSKYGVLIGAYLVDPLGLKNTNLRLEYAFVNQWCYTHESGLLAYTDMERAIGHPMGNDADSLELDLSNVLSPHLQCGLRFSLRRKGETGINDIHPEDGPEEWEFLSGIEEIRRSLTLYLTLLRSAWRLDLTAEVYQIGNLNHENGKSSSGLRLGFRLGRSRWRGVN